MRLNKYIAIAVFLFILVSCKENEYRIFSASIPENNITFEALPGKSKMTYEMPDNAEIRYLLAEYNDEFGKEVKIKGSYLNNELYLPGFLKARDNISVNIFLIDHDGNKSKALPMFFSVLESTAADVLTNAEIKSYWGGFEIKYSASDNVGFLHISYVNTDPLVNELDTIYVKTIPITEGTHSEKLNLFQNPDIKMATAVIWTENDRGNFAGKRTEEVPVLISGKMESGNFALVEGSSMEDTDRAAGWKYLFNGDTKGREFFKAPVANYRKQGFYSYVSEDYAVPGGLVFDLGKDEVLAGIRLYAPLSFGYLSPDEMFYMGMLPNKVKVFGSNDYNAASQAGNWVELGDYYHNNQSPLETRWCWRAYQGSEFHGYQYQVPREISEKDALAAIEAADPCYLKIDFDVSEEKYQFIKLEVDEVYTYLTEEGDTEFFDVNPTQMMTFQELEVFIKK